METLKDWYRGGDPKAPVPKLVVGAFGAFAGAASVFGNTPIDVIKTRMQVNQQDGNVMYLSMPIHLQLLSVRYGQKSVKLLSFSKLASTLR